VLGCQVEGNFLDWLLGLKGLTCTRLNMVNIPNSQNKRQVHLCCTKMYLVWFLVNFALFCLYLWILQDFTDLTKLVAPWPHKISEALYTFTCTQLQSPPILCFQKTLYPNVEKRCIGFFAIEIQVVFSEIYNLDFPAVRIWVVSFN